MFSFRLKRLQLFEFTDLKWWPNIFRTMTTTFLQAMIEKNKPYSPRIDLIVEAIKSTDSTKIVDLCAGNLGPWLHLKQEMQENCNKEIDITFTDKYPNKELSHLISNLDNYTYYPKSVDVRDIPDELVGTRTIFNGLHHFNKKDAQKILDNSVQQKQPIIIFEILERSWSTLFKSLFLTPFYVLISFPFLMKLSFKNIFFTYIIPIFPIIFTWDTLVSNLRSYTEEELEEMIKKANIDKSYRWNIGSYEHRRIPILYLIAYPTLK